MRECGTSNEDEMVLAFLRAEIDSVRFSPVYRALLAQGGWKRADLIDHADLANPCANDARAFLLSQARGFRRNTLLFRGFPEVVNWRRIELEPMDVGRLVYASHPTWNALSGGTRRVVDGASNLRRVQTDANVHISAVASLVVSGSTFPELIAVDPGNQEELILMEGHTRATAYVVAGTPRAFGVLVGSSPRISEWAFY